MNEWVRIRLNGNWIEAPRGATILDVAKREGVTIPTLCHSPLLRPLDNCRLCVVQVSGEKQYRAACSTVVAENMEIATESEELRKTRKLLLELLLDTHYGDCVAPCSLACPANVDIQGYLALIRNGEYREAVRLIKEKIPMPAVIGRVCPRPCEAVCRRHLVDEAVNINYCKRFAADYEMSTGRRILPEVPSHSGHHVAVVGGGPSGLSAAYYLRSLGHGVTIYEEREKLGGMLRYGIPEYRLPRRVLDWEIDGILSLGVEVKTGVSWGKDFTLDDLKRDGFDVVYLAIGAWAARTLGVVGEELHGVVRGIDFLEQLNGSGRMEGVAEKRLAIIGGGNVAIDAARSALRLGAREVTILYRRSRNEMPATHEEIEAAEKEGVDIQYLVTPTQMAKQIEPPIKVQCIRMELGKPDASGRRRPIPVERSETTLEVDMVISAIGQYSQIPDPENDIAMSQLPVTRWNTIGGDPRSMHTGQGQVFTGGDLFRGPSTVVAALADGRKAAYSIDRCLTSGVVEPEPLHFNISKGDLETIDQEPFSVMKTISPQLMPELDVKARIDAFQEVELGLGEDQAKDEATRCLVCGCSAAFDCRLRDFMNEFQVDWRDQPSKKIHYQHVAAADVHPVIALDPNKCIRCERCNVACATFQCSDAIVLKDWPRFNDRCVQCGLCVDLCPTGALMEKRDGRAIERLDWRSIPTHCIHCGCGCRIELKVKGERLIWISDGHEGPPNWASTCERGRFHTYDSVWFGDRVTTPLIRRKGRLKEATWDEALSAVIEGFAGARDRYGAKTLGALASPQAANEALYLLQKWMRVSWKSNGVGFPGRETREKLWSLLEPHGGLRGLHMEFAGLTQADAILLVGDDMEAMAPVLTTMVRRTGRIRRAPVFQVSSRPNSLTPFTTAAIHAPAQNWKDILSQLLQVAVKEKGNEKEKKKKSLRGDTPITTVAMGSGPGPGETLESMVAALKGAIAAGQSMALVFPDSIGEQEETGQLVEILGQFAGTAPHGEAEHGVELYPVTPDINSTGALLMGVSPKRLPGFALLSDQEARRHCATLWQTTDLPEDQLDSVEEALESKETRALFIQNAASLCETNAVRWKRLLKKIDFLVVQESVPSQAMDFARVVLPACAFGEQSGTVFNMERRLLQLKQAFSSPGQALPDWEILRRLMAAQGFEVPPDLEGIQREIAKAAPDLGGLFVS